MSTSPSVFPFAHIALTAAITAGAALLVLVALRARFKAFPLVDCLLVAGVSASRSWSGDQRAIQGH